MVGMMIANNKPNIAPTINDSMGLNFICVNAEAMKPIIDMKIEPQIAVTI